MQKEAKAHIKINNLLQASGWRFFDDQNGSANIALENNVKLTSDYITLTQNPTYQKDPRWNDDKKSELVREYDLKFLRPYQLKAIEALQGWANNGKDRYLFEMATGTGKTLTCAAVIKLFLKTGNAKRVLFLVDHIELEDQASKNFKKWLSNDNLNGHTKWLDGYKSSKTRVCVTVGCNNFRHTRNGKS